MQLGRLPFGYDHKYTYSHVGYNLKITDWQAAIGCAQLQKLPSFVEKRRENVSFLRRGLSDLEKHLLLPQHYDAAAPAYFGFAISVRPGERFDARGIVAHLEGCGIATRTLFSGNILRHPMFVDNALPVRIGDSPLMLSHNLSEKDYAALPNTDFIMNNTFYVGCYPGLEEKDLSKISEVIHDYVKLKA
jgi:CDP-6-deoxy-D-xylo-4-hexulose-3-dehydrase